ncbi:ParA family protein [Enterococcus hirae]|nr:ParA family protein [Enterococcus hirae]
MKTLTVNIEKGGTGKSSTIYNVAEKVSKTASVLLIDQDKSGNLTDRYSKYDYGLMKDENKISNLYKGKNLEPIHIHKNLDLLAGGHELADMEDFIRDKPNNRLILFSWFVKNIEVLQNKYDYIFIDTHNDTSLITQNAWAVSDIILGVSDPSMDGFKALLKLGRDIDTLRKELVEVRTGESYLIADYYFIGNKVKHNTNSSKEFLEIISKEPNYLGYIPDKELINTANLEMIPLVEYSENKELYNKHKNFFNQTWKVYDTILNKLNGSDQ